MKASVAVKNIRRERLHGSWDGSPAASLSPYISSQSSTERRIFSFRYCDFIITQPQHHHRRKSPVQSVKLSLLYIYYIQFSRHFTQLKSKKKKKSLKNYIFCVRASYNPSQGRDREDLPSGVRRARRTFSIIFFGLYTPHNKKLLFQVAAAEEICALWPPVELSILLRERESLFQAHARRDDGLPLCDENNNIYAYIYAGGGQLR